MPKPTAQGARASVRTRLGKCPPAGGGGGASPGTLRLGTCLKKAGLVGRGRLGDHPRTSDMLSPLPRAPVPTWHYTSCPAPASPQCWAGGLLPSPPPQPLRQRMRGTHMRPLLLFFSEIPCQSLAGPGGLSLEATSRKPSLSILPRAVLPVWALPTTGRVTAGTEGPGRRGRSSRKQVSSVLPGSAQGSCVTTGPPGGSAIQARPWAAPLPAPPPQCPPPNTCPSRPAAGG